MSPRALFLSASTSQSVLLLLQVGGSTFSDVLALDAAPRLRACLRRQSLKPTEGTRQLYE